MKPNELKILKLLRQDARLSLTKMSRQTKVPVSTIYDKLKVYQTGLIKKHTSILDFTKMGYNTRATVLIRVVKNQRNKIQKFLMENPHVNSVYKVNNGFDFMVEFVFRNIKEMEDYMEEMDSQFDITNKQTHYLIDDLCRETFLTSPMAIA